jgi:signal transduction histidine kinase
MDELLDMAPCGFVTFDNDGTIQLINTTLRSWLGYQAGELQGEHFQMLLSEGSRIFYQNYVSPRLKLEGAADAIKFTDHGEVRIKLGDADPAAGQICISVIDTGVGIAPADQARLFQAFQRVGTADIQRREGTGLGLQLSRKLAELLGGASELTSQLARAACSPSHCRASSASTSGDLGYNQHIFML